MFPCQYCQRRFEYNFELKTHIKLEHNRHDCLSCHLVFGSPGDLDKHLWTTKTCKSPHSIQYGLKKDEIVREQEKRSIDLYIKNVHRFHSSMSNLQNLTDIVLENCLEIKYFILFNAYNINDLSVSVQEKSNYKNKMNDLKTFFF